MIEGHLRLGYIIWQRWRQVILGGSDLISQALRLYSERKKSRQKNSKQQGHSPAGLEEANSMCREGHVPGGGGQLLGDEGFVPQSQGSEFCQQPVSLEEDPGPQLRSWPWPTP